MAKDNRSAAQKNRWKDHNRGVVKILREAAKGGWTCQELADKLGCSRANAHKRLKGSGLLEEWQKNREAREGKQPKGWWATRRGRIAKVAYVTMRDCGHVFTFQDGPKGGVHIRCDGREMRIVAPRKPNKTSKHGRPYFRISIAHPDWTYVIGISGMVLVFKPPYSVKALYIDEEGKCAHVPSYRIKWVDKDES